MTAYELYHCLIAFLSQFLRQIDHLKSTRSICQIASASGSIRKSALSDHFYQIAATPQINIGSSVAVRIQKRRVEEREEGRGRWRWG
jgi:hypothetical protein